MKVIGFNFTKINSARLKEGLDSKEELKINTEIDVPRIKEIKSHILNTKDNILEADFTYKIKYNPNFATIDFEGKVLLSVEPSLTKEIFKEWKKKKLQDDFRMLLFNVVLKKSSLKALHLEEELNLPLHIPMPSFRRQEK